MAYLSHRLHHFSRDSPPNSLGFYQPSVQYIARQPIPALNAIKWKEDWHKKNDAKREVDITHEKEENVGDSNTDEKGFSKKENKNRKNTPEKSPDYNKKADEELLTKQQFISMTNQQLEYIKHLVRINAFFEFQQISGNQNDSPKSEEDCYEEVPIYPTPQKIAELEEKVKDLQEEREQSQNLLEEMRKQIQKMKNQKQQSKIHDDEHHKQIQELKEQLKKQNENKENVPIYPEQQTQEEKMDELREKVLYLTNSMLELQKENEQCHVTEERQNTLIGELRKQLEKKNYECDSYKKLWPSGGRVEDCLTNCIGRQIFNGADTGLLQKLIHEVKEMTTSGSAPESASECAMALNHAFKFEVSCHGCAIVNQRDVTEGLFMIILMKEVAKSLQDQISEEIERFNIPEKQGKICIIMTQLGNDNPSPNSTDKISADFINKHSISTIKEFLFKTEEYGYYQCDLNDRGVKDLARIYCQEKYGITVHVA